MKKFCFIFLSFLMSFSLYATQTTKFSNWNAYIQVRDSESGKDSKTYSITAKKGDVLSFTYSGQVTAYASNSPWYSYFSVKVGNSRILYKEGNQYVTYDENKFSGTFTYIFTSDQTTNLIFELFKGQHSTASCYVSNIMIKSRVQCEDVSYGIISDSTVYLVDGQNAKNNLIIPTCIKDPDDGKQYIVSGIYDYAFANNTNINNISIGERVESIGSRAFSGCNMLSEIFIPNSVTSIGGSAFSDCSGLTELSLPRSITNIEGYPFSGCKGKLIINCKIGSGNSYSKTGWFSYSNFDSVEFGEDVNEIPWYTFSKSRIKQITISKNIKKVGCDVFIECSNLAKIYIEDGNSTLYTGFQDNTSSSYSNYGLFKDCPIEYLYLGRNLNTQNSGSCNEPFANKKEIRTIVVGDSVSSLATGAFSGCTNLKEVKLSSKCNISSNLFYGCSNLENVSIPNTVSTIYDYAFCGCSELANVSFPENLKSIGDKAFSGCTKLNEILLPTNISKIGSGAFSGCSSLKTVSLPNSITNLGTNLFYGCNLDLINIKLINWGGCNLYSSIPNSATWKYYIRGSELSGNVVIPDSVKTIGSYVLYKCSSVNEVIISNNVKEISEGAFEYCSNLKNLTIPSNVTSIGNDAFTGCTSVKEVKIEDGTTTLNLGYKSNSSYSSYYYGLFKDCPIEKLYLGRNLSYSTRSDNSSYPGYGAPFEYQSQMKSVEIGKNVTSIDYYAFYGCSGLTSLTIPSSVTSIGSSAFYGCSGKLTVNCNIGSASSSNYGWFYGSKFSSVEISKDVTSIGNYAFYGNSNIQSLTIGSGVTTIGSNAFSDTPTKVFWLTNTPPSGYSVAKGKVNYVSNNNFTSLSNTKVYAYLSSMFEDKGIKYVPVNPSERTCDAIDYAYFDVDSVLNIANTVSYRNVAMNVKEIGEYFAYNNTIVKELKIGDAIPTIRTNAFYGCTSMTKAEIGQGVTSIETEAFRGCSKLQEIAIPDATTSLGTYCFYDCDSLKKADTGDGVTAIPARTFYGCSALETITIGEGVKSIGTYAFAFCSSLADIAIPSNVNKIDNYAFYYCKKLADVVIADRKLELSLGYNGSSEPLFSDCPLDSLYIGGKITYSTSSSYGYSPFYRNTSLRTVVITNEETEIYPNEFYGCTGLKNVKIGDGVKKIGDYAFSGCSKLASFGFGEGMKSIGKEAFSDCISLTKILSEAAVPPTCGSQALEDINKWECTLYVPKANIAAYQAADQWKDFFFVEENVEAPLFFVLSYVVDGEIYHNDTIKEGATITPIAEPTKEGYTFSGWNDCPDVMPAHDVEVTGSFSINNYTLIYKVDGVVFKTSTVQYGTTISPEEGPTKTGYTFSGWSEIPATMPAHDVEVTGSFTINTYRVELTVGEGGTATISNESPEYGSSVILTITPDTGYELASVMVNDNDVTAQIGNGSYTIEAIKADLKISVSFSVIVGIEKITTDAMPTDLYDLSGRKVQNARQGSFFVQNGKKLIVK